MSKLTIDGKEVEVAAGTTVIRAAEQAGIDIPHFCWHPGLPVDGNCRMCLVTVEKQPKPVIACAAVCQDGMAVHTNTDEVKAMRKGVMEFLLANHPLDCPICDCAGECDLQENYFKHNGVHSRFAEPKVHKPKVQDLGPNIVLDQERCILCSRCVRFTAEVSKTHELGIFGRGATAKLDVVPGKKLDNNYSTNTVDLCPVGALTDKRFRFKSRVWFLKRAESVCPGCSRGCNIFIDYNLAPINKVGQKRIYRFKPRHNPDVNQYWMCDYGRYLFPQTDENRLTRIVVPVPVGAGPCGQRVIQAGPPLPAIADHLKSSGPVAVLLSRRSTNESLWAAKKFFSRVVRATDLTSDVPSGGSSDEDAILLKADKYPNTKGAELLGAAGSKSGEAILKAAAEGKYGALVVVDHDLPALYGELAARAISKTPFVLYLATHQTGTMPLAHAILPLAMFSEQDGSFTNFEGRVQRIHQAVEPAGEAQPEWAVWTALAKALGEDWPEKSAEDWLASIAALVPGFEGVTRESIGPGGLVVGHDLPAPTKKAW